MNMKRHVQMLAEHRGLALGRGDCNKVASPPPVDERERCKQSVPAWSRGRVPGGRVKELLKAELI